MKTAQTEPGCPAEMAVIPAADGQFCIDRFEASIVCRMPSGETRTWPGNVAVDGIEDEIVAVSQKGTKPQGYISGIQAGLACEHAGKRLCSSDEWVTACRGPAHTLYPYGNQRRAGACNDRFKTLDFHPVVRLFHEVAPRGTNEKLMWTTSWINDPRLLELSHTVSPTGSFPDCVNDYGLADMVGNLHEWVADPQGMFRGGFFMDTYQHGEGCDYRTSAHPMKYHDYSTGFRCCADPSGTSDSSVAARSSGISRQQRKPR